MSDLILLNGVLGTQPELKVSERGKAVLTFRLASPQRKFDKDQNAWVEGNTNWYTVVAFGRLAENAADSLGKGDRVIVSGKLRIESWERNGKSGTAIEVLADSMGHDLFWGTTSFRKPTGGSSHSAPARDPWDSPEAPF